MVYIQGYRVDPLTRENISESKTYGVNEPLIEVVYGAKNDSLKCKLDLVDIAEEIKNRRGTSYWNGYKSGEMYRIEFSVEEKLGTGFQSSGKFLNDFEAKTTSSILFLCSSKNTANGIINLYVITLCCIKISVAERG